MSKPFVVGSVEWVEAFRQGAFSKRPPVLDAPMHPSPLSVSRRSRRLGNLARYNGIACPYCTKTMMEDSPRRPTRDHILPRSRGGTLSDRNCIIVCSPCNHNKGNMTLQEFVGWLRIRNDYRADIVSNLLERYRARS